MKKREKGVIFLKRGVEVETKSEALMREIGLDPTRFANAQGYVFDFGGVISVSPIPKWDQTLYPYLEQQGLTREQARAGWKRWRYLWDGGFISFADFYRKVFAEVGVEPTAEVLDYLWRVDAAGWVEEFRPETWELMKALKREGRKVGILTNMSADFFEKLYVPRCAEYRALIDAEVVSGLERLYKPEKPIYDLMASRMGLSPAQLVFFDDTEANVLAARSFGWSSELYPAPCR